ncbi:MAG: hypothetical protein KDB79_17145 [Acidobacteria bacterium]|nr:hypothetical protein [Acidobacteriota bacterium]
MQVFEEKIRTIVREEMDKVAPRGLPEKTPDIRELQGLHFGHEGTEFTDETDEQLQAKEELIRSEIEKRDRIKNLPLRKGAKTFQDE